MKQIKQDAQHAVMAGLMLVLMCISGCKNTLSTSEQVPTAEASTAQAIDVNVSFGSYQISGQLIPVADAQIEQEAVKPQWRFVHPDTEFVLNRYGLVSVQKLDGRSIHLHLNRVKSDKNQFVQVQIRQALANTDEQKLNYIVLTCETWQQQWNIHRQYCQANGAEPAHTTEVQLNNQQPVAISQWLPYLQLLFTLQRI